MVDKSSVMTFAREEVAGFSSPLDLDQVVYLTRSRISLKKSIPLFSIPQSWKALWSRSFRTSVV